MSEFGDKKSVLDLGGKTNFDANIVGFFVEISKFNKRESAHVVEMKRCNEKFLYRFYVWKSCLNAFAKRSCHENLFWRLLNRGNLKIQNWLIYGNFVVLSCWYGLRIYFFWSMEDITVILLQKESPNASNDGLKAFFHSFNKFAHFQRHSCLLLESAMAHFWADGQ